MIKTYYLSHRFSLWFILFYMFFFTYKIEAKTDTISLKIFDVKSSEVNCKERTNNTYKYDFLPPVTTPLINPPCSSSKIVLPIEVLGEEGQVVERCFNLDQQQAAKVKRLWLQVNNLSYENKASIQVNNGNWLPLNHQTTEIQYQEKARGGMVHGGFNTIRFSIPVTDFVSGGNNVRFRFNKSDGISIGYRVIKLNLLDANGSKIISEATFLEDNPENWEPPIAGQAAIDAGKNLWKNADLMNHYLAPGVKGFWYNQELPTRRPIRAKCASCHAQDGRDLEIFSYSNASIIERSKYHNLTEEEGRQIASYIRSLSEEHTNVGRYGRPWNPPYQPGPEIANKPIEQWAAGAGLDAVLNKDEDMLSHLFPSGVTKQTVNDWFNSDRMDDRTIIPLAIQFPDWKHWLPMIHPIDAFNKNGYIESPARQRNPIKGIQDFRNYLEAMPPENRNKSEFLSKMSEMWRHFRFFFAEGGTDEHWRTKNGLAAQHLSDDISREWAATSLARLLAVKNFEFMNEFDLQDKAHWFVDPIDQPGERQWIGNRYSVFEIPAHFQACVDNDCSQFKTQPTTTGLYETTNWYHLQFVLNGGNGFVEDVSPTDFNYQHPFIIKSSIHSGINEPVRYFASYNWMYQVRSWTGDPSPNSIKGFRMRNQGPWTAYGISDSNEFFGMPAGEWHGMLNDIKPGLSLWVLEAELRQFLKEVQKPEFDLTRWNRQPIGNQSHSLDTANKNSVFDISTTRDIFNYADKFYYLIPKFKEAGVDCHIMDQLINWSKEAWPLLDWEKFRVTSCIDASNNIRTIVKTAYFGSIPVQSATLNAGAVLGVNQPVASFDGRTLLIVQGDGNVVIYQDPDGNGTKKGIPFFGTNVNGVTRLVIQGDGNIVGYDSHGEVVKATNTNGNTGNKLYLLENGNIVYKGSDGSNIWSSRSPLSENAKPIVDYNCDCTGDVLCILGGSCDDGNSCTVNDEYDADCNCKGVYSDQADCDEDGVTNILDCDPYDTQNTNIIGGHCADSSSNIRTASYSGSPLLISELNAGTALGVNQPVASVDGRTVLVIQGDGNVVVYQDPDGNGSKKGMPFFSNNVNGVTRLAIQGDGNIVGYDKNGQAVSATNTSGNGYRLLLQNDGNIVYKDTNGNDIWISKSSLSAIAGPVVDYNCHCTENKYGLAKNDTKDDQRNKLQVFPNPAASLFTIQSYEKIAIHSISVFTLQGRLIYNKKMNDRSTFNHEINVQTWENNMYILKIETDQLTHYKKILVE